MIFFIIVHKNKNNITLRTLAVNARGQKCRFSKNGCVFKINLTSLCGVRPRMRISKHENHSHFQKQFTSRLDLGHTYISFAGPRSRTENPGNFVFKLRPSFVTRILSLLYLHDRRSMNCGGQGSFYGRKQLFQSINQFIYYAIVSKQTSIEQWDEIISKVCTKKKQIGLNIKKYMSGQTVLLPK